MKIRVHVAAGEVRRVLLMGRGGSGIWSGTSNDKSELEGLTLPTESLNTNGIIHFSGRSAP